MLTIVSQMLRLLTMGGRVREKFIKIVFKVPKICVKETS